MKKKKKKIVPMGWAYARGFRGKVVRIRRFNGETLVDLEIGGVIDPYKINEVIPE